MTRRRDVEKTLRGQAVLDPGNVAIPRPRPAQSDAQIARRPRAHRQEVERLVEDDRALQRAQDVQRLRSR
jgi:hypothetical protein